MSEPTLHVPGPPSTLSLRPYAFDLLQENGSRILQEDGFRILTEGFSESIELGISAGPSNILTIPTLSTSVRVP